MLAPMSGTLGGAATRRWRRPLVRAALFCAAFGFLWFAEHRHAAWQRDMSTTFQAHTAGWATWMLATAAVGFCVALAAFLPAGRITFRPVQASVLAILPVLGILHFGGVVLWGWHLPGFLMKAYFYLDVGPQAVLAMIVGVALAASIRAAGDHSTPREAT